MLSIAITLIVLALIVIVYAWLNNLKYRRQNNTSGYAPQYIARLSLASLFLGIGSLFAAFPPNPNSFTAFIFALVGLLLSAILAWAYRFNW